MSKPIQTPLSRTARLLDLVPYLSSHQGISLGDLASTFEVSEAQLVSDLTTLWMCGLPGYTPLELMDLSFDSGFVTIHNADTLARPRTLSDEETIALLLGLDLVIESLPLDRSDLKDQALELVRKLSERASLSAQLRAVPSIAGTLRAQIQDAVRKKNALEILYHTSSTDNVSTRVVLPIELKSEGGFEYLIGVCQSAHAIRNFRLDRIQSASLLTLTPPNNAQLSSQEDLPISYTLRINSHHRDAMERFAIDKQDFKSEVTVSSYSEEWIRRCVVSSSGSVELVEPANIRANIAASAQNILSLYARE